MSAVAKVPTLRFPEFNGEWDSKSLSRLGEIIGGGTPETGKPDYWNGGIQWFTPTELKSKYVSTSTRAITELGLKKSSAKLLPKYSLLLSTRASVGDISIALNECTTNQGFQSIVVNAQNDFEFLYYVLVNNKKEIVRHACGSTFLEINKKEVSKLKFFVPPKTEQHKIASFLTAVDSKIEQLTKKRSLLEQYKKGVMQKIFSREIRFRAVDGSEFPEWEEKKLGEVATKKSSNISANKIEANIGDYIIYGASGVLKKVDFFEEAENYISIVKDGAGVGRIFYCQEKSSVLGTMDIIKPKKDVNAYYLYCLLELINFNKYVIGSTIPHIYFKDYAHEICMLPSVNEQTKIADFLSSIDTKIDLVAKELESARQFKKGLLQQMFV